LQSESTKTCYDDSDGKLDDPVRLCGRDGDV